MADKLGELVKKALDGSIRSFHPKAPGAFETWDGELERVERLVVQAPSSAGGERWLEEIRAQRILLAWEVGRNDLVLERSQRFLRDFPPAVPSYGSVVALRARTLHQAGAHGEERTLVQETAARPEICGSDCVSLLADLAGRHAGSISADPRLADKMQRALQDLGGEGYEGLLSLLREEVPLEELALRSAAEIRRVSRERGEEMLAGGT
jgi:hypothetical protein